MFEDEPEFFCGIEGATLANDLGEAGSLGEAETLDDDLIYVVGALAGEAGAFEFVGVCHLEASAGATTGPAADGGVSCEHADAVVAVSRCDVQCYVPRERRTGTMARLPDEWTMIACPRVICDQTTRIGLGHIGPKVRNLVKHAHFPIFIPSMSFKPWTNVTAFFGGSKLGATSVKAGMAIARLARVPFTIHTQLDGITKKDCEQSLSEAGMAKVMSASDVDWRFHDVGTLEENLYAVPHDSLVVVGAAGHKLITELVFGSKLEMIQATLPNPMVIVGPDCRTPIDS